MRKSRIYATPIEPTSPAKHLAFPFRRKLKKQKTMSASATTAIRDSSAKPSSLFRRNHMDNGSAVRDRINAKEETAISYSFCH